MDSFRCLWYLEYTGISFSFISVNTEIAYDLVVLQKGNVVRYAYTCVLPNAYNNPTVSFDKRM
jgi:hypothetical protein